MALEEDFEDCEPCRVAAGIGLMARLCPELKPQKIDCEKLVAQVQEGGISVREFIDQIEGAINESSNEDKTNTLEVFDEIKSLMLQKMSTEEEAYG